MAIIALIIMAFLGLLVFTGAIQSLKMKLIPRKSTDKLVALFRSRSNACYFNQAVIELQRRGEDIDFVYPVLVDLTLSKTLVAAIGKSCLRHYFPEKVAHIDFPEAPTAALSPEARAQIEAL
ncbi:MAG: hypothetical protein ACI8W8_003984, partial [Rhodothermales bacterium]